MFFSQHSGLQRRANVNVILFFFLRLIASHSMTLVGSLDKISHNVVTPRRKKRVDEIFLITKRYYIVRFVFCSCCWSVLNLDCCYCVVIYPYLTLYVSVWHVNKGEIKGTPDRTPLEPRPLMMLCFMSLNYLTSHLLQLPLISWTFDFAADFEFWSFGLHQLTLNLMAEQFHDNTE